MNEHKRTSACTHDGRTNARTRNRQADERTHARQTNECTHPRTHGRWMNECMHDERTNECTHAHTTDEWTHARMTNEWMHARTHARRTNEQMYVYMHDLPDPSLLPGNHKMPAPSCSTSALPDNVAGAWAQICAQFWWRAPLRSHKSPPRQLQGCRWATRWRNAHHVHLFWVYTVFNEFICTLEALYT